MAIRTRSRECSRSSNAQRAGQAVRCIGHVAPADMGRTMERYGAMVLPSFPESFGLVYLEALAAGIPVMSSRGYALDGFFSAGWPGVQR